MKILLGADPPALPSVNPKQAAIQTIEKVVQIHSEYWSSLLPKFSPIADGSAWIISLEPPDSMVSMVDLLATFWSYRLERGYGLAPVDPKEDSKIVPGTVHMSENIYACSELVVLFQNSSEMRHFSLIQGHVDDEELHTVQRCFRSNLS
jgi:hypothetical protein